MYFLSLSLQSEVSNAFFIPLVVVGLDLDDPSKLFLHAMKAMIQSHFNLSKESAAVRSLLLSPPSLPICERYARDRMQNCNDLAKLRPDECSLLLADNLTKPVESVQDRSVPSDYELTIRSASVSRNSSSFACRTYVTSSNSEPHHSWDQCLFSHASICDSEIPTGRHSSIYSCPITSGSKCGCLLGFQHGSQKPNSGCVHETPLVAGRIQNSVETQPPHAPRS
jgi:hypothetical protein